MRITSSSDWRDAIPFETPMIVAEVVPGEPTRCSVCGGGSEPLPRTQLWAVKHRHPNQHAGYVRFYCLEHRPAIVRPPAPVETRRSLARTERAQRGERVSAPRRTPTPDAAPRAMCPDCFVEVSAAGVCGICSQQVV